MKNKALPITIILFILSIGNYIRLAPQSLVKAVEFLSILIIGILIGVLVTQIIARISVNRHRTYEKEVL
jgi:hypothetical protein